MNVEQKVAEWNAEYKAMGRELNLENLTPDAYEAEVGSALLGVCDENIDMAIAVFEHPDNKGGWMAGDVVAWIKKQEA